MSSRWLRNSFIYLLILVAVVAIVFSFFHGGSDSKSIPYSEVLTSASDHTLDSVQVSGQSLDVRKKNDQTKYTSRIGSNTDLEKDLKDAGASLTGSGDAAITVKYKSPSSYGDILGLLVTFAPILVFGAI